MDKTDIIAGIKIELSDEQLDQVAGGEEWVPLVGKKAINAAVRL